MITYSDADPITPIHEFLVSPEGRDGFLQEQIAQSDRGSVLHAIFKAFEYDESLTAENLSEKDKGTVACALYENATAFNRIGEYVRSLNFKSSELDDFDLMYLCSFNSQNSGHIIEMERRIRTRDDFAINFDIIHSLKEVNWFMSKSSYANQQFMCTLVERCDVTSGFKYSERELSYNSKSLTPEGFASIHSVVIRYADKTEKLFQGDHKYKVLDRIMANLSTNISCLSLEAENAINYGKYLSSIDHDSSFVSNRNFNQKILSAYTSVVFSKIDDLASCADDLKKLCAGLSALSNDDFKITVSPQSSLLAGFLATQVDYTSPAEDIAERIINQMSVGHDELVALADSDWKFSLLENFMDRDKLIKSGQKKVRGLLLSSELGL